MLPIRDLLPHVWLAGIEVSATLEAMEPRYSTLVHVIAAFGVIGSLGAICLGVRDDQRKLASILHGISLLLLLLMGLHLVFSMDLVKSGGWWHTKILLWLALGVAPVLAKRKILPPGALIAICLGIAAFATFLVQFRPF